MVIVEKDGDNWKRLWLLRKIVMTVWWLKNIVDDWKILWWLKNTVVIEKDCDNWKRLWLKKFMLVIGWMLVVM